MLLLAVVGPYFPIGGWLHRHDDMLTCGHADFNLYNPLFYADMSGFQTLSKAPGSTGTVIAIETKTTITETTATTAATTLLLHVAWLGDSKAVLSSTNGTVVELSLDHRGTNPVEAERINNVGGFITSKGKLMLLA